MMLADRIGAQPVIVRRALAVLLALVIVGMLWVAIVRPVQYIAVSQERWRAAAIRDLARNRAIVGIGARMRTESPGLKSAPVWNRFFPAREGLDATQLVQRDVLSLASQAGAVVQSATPLPAIDAQELRGHGVRIVASMTVDQLKNLITHLRAHPRYLRTQQLSISAPQSQTDRENPPLTVSLDVVGYSRPAAAPTTQERA